MAYIQRYYHCVDDNMTYIINIIMVVNDIVISNAALQLLAILMTTIASVKGRDTIRSTDGCSWGFRIMFIIWNSHFRHFLFFQQDFLGGYGFRRGDFFAELFLSVVAGCRGLFRIVPFASYVRAWYVLHTYVGVNQDCFTELLHRDQ